MRVVTMPHLARLPNKKMVLHANLVLVLGLVWGSLALCAAAAVVYDINRWIGAW